jgi:hypothetical protein
MQTRPFSILVLDVHVARACKPSMHVKQHACACEKDVGYVFFFVDLFFMYSAHHE